MFSLLFIIILSIISMLVLFLWLKQVAGFSNTKLAWNLFCRTLITFIFVALIALNVDYRILNSFYGFIVLTAIYLVIIYFLYVLRKQYIKIK